ncbi:pectinesterase-like [Arachis stenosperma]|uniref:pectinesterase-like n=1 Tax=Arachis stenosperma TaxID=217475 RepID=UPI0025AC0B67|nr:pectinesterase-like [Arachis stenosperma]
MANQQQRPLLSNNNNKTPKFLSLLLTTVVVVVVGIGVLASSSLIANSYLSTKPSSDLCQHAVNRATCLAHVSEIAQGHILATTKDNYNLLQSFLVKSTSGIQEAMATANAVKIRLNATPRQEAALQVCADLMDLSISRVYDSVVALTKRTTLSLQDAHTWLSSVLTNHATCLDGLDGSARAIMEPQLSDLMSWARTSLAMFVAVLPTKAHRHQLLEEPLNREFPSWVTRTDRRLLESVAADIKANVVVAKDGSGKFKTVAEAVASAPDNGKTRYVIYVKKGTYKENVEISSKKKNVMLVGDGMDATIITGSLNFVDGTGTFQSATVAAVGDGFIGQDIWFQNTAGPEKHQAVALRVGADTSVINRCRIDAYQDTLYTHSNRQFYRDCVITGTIDFIFGNAAVVFQNCNLVARKPMSNQKNMVTAQGREDPNQNTGTSIQQCKITASSDLKPVVGSIKTYLGRPWKKYSRTVVMQSSIDGHIDPAGWSEWDDKTKDYLETLYYGEYMNSGAGAGTSKRVTWPGYHIITSAAEASKFTVAQLIQGDVWLQNTGVNFITGL